MNLLNRELGSVPVATTPSKLSDEQKEIVGQDLEPGELFKVIAYAGTGKTSTLVAYSEKRSNIEMTYLAFNKSVEQEAKARFGTNVLPKTVHAMAYSVVGRRYKNISGSVPNWLIAKAMRCPIYEASLIAKTLESYLNSASEQVELEHVEPDHLNRLANDYQEGLRDNTRAVWEAVKNESHGLTMTHSGYLKLYQLSNPTLPGEIILLDEAQDTNPVTQDIVLSQITKGKAVILVGDPYQQIYAWRGAVDALQIVDCPTFRLSQSWRFGDEVADVANLILKRFFNEQTPLVGMRNNVSAAESFTTLVARTNSKVFESAASLAQQSQQFHVIGREAFYGILDQLMDLFFLYCGKRDRIMNRQIARHQHYQALCEYAESTLDLELQGRCRIVGAYKDQLPNTIAKIREFYLREPQNDAPVLVTCHKAKGLEWDSVRLSEDYEELYDENGKLRRIPEIGKDEVNLLYVAATRAKNKVWLNHDLKRLSASQGITDEDVQDNQDNEDKV